MTLSFYRYSAAMSTPRREKIYISLDSVVPKHSDLEDGRLTGGHPAGIIWDVSSLPLLQDIEAALFDLDGTLVETNIDFTLMKRRTLELAARHGADPGALAGLDILSIIEETAATMPSGRAGEFRRRAWDTLEEMEMESLTRARVMDGCEELLRELQRRGIRTGIVTRNCRRAAAILVDMLPLKVDVWLAREDVSRTKPDPAHIRAALDALRVEAQRALMVGDHPMDVRAGREAGCRTVGLLGGREPGYFDEAGPDAVFPDLRSLCDALLGVDR